MNEENPKTASSSGITWLTIGFLALVAYLLSPGIFVAMVGRGGWRPKNVAVFEETFVTVYNPIFFACRWQPVGDFYTWYLSICLDGEYNAHGY